MGCDGYPRIRLTLGINDSDQVRDLVSGRVPVTGIELTCLVTEVEEIFFRFTKHREWEISELSLAKCCALRSRGDDSLVAIPVFPSRAFRHSAIYIRADGRVHDPGALRGTRIGIPEWTVTATVYARGLLQHEYGIDLRDVRWVQGGTNEPGRIETLPVTLPAGIAVEAERERALNDMLLSGDIDAVIAPQPPAAFTDRSGGVVRLFSDHAAEEKAYYQRAGVFPIMHVIVLRRDVNERYPWAAANLYRAFTEAKRRSVQRMLDDKAPRTPLAWGSVSARSAEALFGKDIWPYGVDANRTTLTTFLTLAEEQGVCEPGLSPDDLFAPQVLEEFRV